MMSKHDKLCYYVGNNKRTLQRWLKDLSALSDEEILSAHAFDTERIPKDEPNEWKPGAHARVREACAKLPITEIIPDARSTRQ